jgi:hypothetical protein
MNKYFKVKYPSKMADEVSEEKEDALQLIVNTAEQSVNMKKRTEADNYRNCKYT